MKRLDERALVAAERAFPMVSGTDVTVRRYRIDAFRIGYRLGHAAGVRTASKRLSSSDTGASR